MSSWEVVTVETSPYQTVLYKAALLLATVEDVTPKGAVVMAMTYVTPENYNNFPSTLPETPEEIDKWLASGA